jgi:simple sugar transport system permease protein
MIGAGIDISVGGVTGFVTMCCSVFLNTQSGSIFGALCLALGIGIAFGLVQGFLVSYLEIQPFIISLAGMFLARGLTTIVAKEPVKVAHEGFLAFHQSRIEIPWLGYVAANGNLITAKVQYGAVVALLIVLTIFIVLRWSRFGRNLYAIGGNNHSALTLGINVKRTRFYSHLLCGTLAGIGGFTYVLHTAAANPAGDARFFEMQAIASSIIGGTLLTGGVGNVIGTLFGTLSLRLITGIVVISGLREPWWQQITTGAMLTFFIVLQSVILKYRGGKGFKLGIPNWLTIKTTNKEIGGEKS